MKQRVSHPSSLLRKGLSSIWQIRFIRYLSMGFINTVFGYLLFVFFIYIGFHYILASLIGTLIGALFSYMTMSNYVFSKGKKSVIWRFIMVYMILYGVTILLLTIGQLIISNMYINGFICTLITSLMSYLINYHIVFRAYYETH